MHASSLPGGVTAVAFLVLSALPAWAQDLSLMEVARKGKAATVLVRSPSARTSRPPPARTPGGFGRGGDAGRGGFGRGGSRTFRSSISAFCIHPSGLFLTTYRSVAGADGVPIRVVCRPGLEAQQEAEAHVVRSDRAADLALLWIPEATGVPPLALGSQDAVRERAEVVTCGFPVRSVSSRGGRGGVGFSLPASTLLIKRSRVLSPATKKGEAELFRLQADPEAGGVVLDRKGQVVGLLAGVGEPGEAVSVTRLKEFLKGPILLLSVPAVKPADAHKPAAFRARMIHPLAPRPGATPVGAPLELDLVLKAGEGKERRFPMTGKAGTYQVTAVPVPAPPGKPRLRVAIAYADGSVEGLTDEQEVKLSGKPYPLRSLVALRQVGKKALAVLTNGQVVEVDPAGLAPLAGEVGGQPWPLGLRQARTVRIDPPEEVAAVSVTVIARRGEAEVARQTHTILLAGPERSETIGQEKVADLERALRSAQPVFDRYAGDKETMDVAEVSGAIGSRGRLEDFARREGITGGRLTRAQFVKYFLEEELSRRVPPSRGGFQRGSRFSDPREGFPRRPDGRGRGRRGGPDGPTP